MAAYYNEIDPYAAQWLRNLIAENLIAKGDVDDRSITEVQAADLRGYTQCHFFAGIGGWSYALRIAGWPDDRPVWTGSCPCQPYSDAGEQRADADERNLWPEFRRLITVGHPPVVFGEQVASKLGRAWLSGVFADLEALEYRRAGADLCAASVGAPHIRQRLFWVADVVRTGFENDQGRPGPAWQTGGGKPSSDAHKFRAPGWLSEPSVGRVVHGLSQNVGAVRGFGNAIVPEITAEFIKAYMEISNGNR